MSIPTCWRTRSPKTSVLALSPQPISTSRPRKTRSARSRTARVARRWITWAGCESRYLRLKAERFARRSAALHVIGGILARGRARCHDGTPYGILSRVSGPPCAPADERTLSIAHVDAELAFSGGEVQVFLLIDGLARRGHRNVLIAPPGSESERAGRARGLEVHSVAMRSDLDLPAVLHLAHALRGARVDLVHLHTGRATWLGAWAALLARRRAVSTRRQERPVARSARTRLLHGRLLARTVAISPAVAECLRQGGVRDPRVIASSVDPALLRPARERASVRAELDLAPDDFAVLTLASLVPRKGVDLLLRAVASLAAAPVRTVLLVAGAGPERAALEELARGLDLGARARFLGARADKAELLAACDAFALASHAEGLGVAALEAMAL